MGLDLPDPETFGECETKPHEKIDQSDYKTLDNWEQ